MSWQYNGIAPWRDIYIWCQEHFGTNFGTNHHETIYFNSEADQVLFLLRWSSR